MSFNIHQHFWQERVALAWKEPCPLGDPPLMALMRDGLDGSPLRVRM